jgi:superfamily II DNA or RNA helicase
MSAVPHLFSYLDDEPPAPFEPAARLQLLPPLRTFRPYQQAASDSVWNDWRANRSSLVVMATGLGKTAVAGRLLRQYLEQGDGRDFLFLAHRTELIDQAFKAFAWTCPGVSVEIEQGDRYSKVQGRAPRCVIGSVASMTESRLQRFPEDRFGAIVIDEAHHYLHRNKSYRRPVQRFSKAKLAGLTATPERDEESLIGKSFDNVAYNYGLYEGITDAWLVPIMQQYVTVEGYRLDHIEEDGSGDLNEAEVAEEMTRDQLLHAVATAAVKYSNHPGPRIKQRQCLIFAASVGHARQLAELLNLWHGRHRTGSAASIDCKNTTGPIREALIERYKRREIRYLVNFGVLTEGFDADCTSVVVIARPTKKKSLYCQMVGRATRTLEVIARLLVQAQTIAERRRIIKQSLKPGAMVVDMVGVSGHHKLVTATDLMGDAYSEKVVARAKKNMAANDNRGRIDKELDAAVEEVRIEETERRRRVIVEAITHSRVIDPFDLMDVTSLREPGWFTGKRPTEKQIDMLLKSGITKKKVKELTRYTASLLIDAIIERRRVGKCTVAQARILTKNGHDPDCSFEDASKVIDEIARRGWRPNYDRRGRD